MNELLEYPRYGYEGDRPCAWFDELDVTTCPRCGDCDIFPGQRVCNMCSGEIQADEDDDYYEDEEKEIVDEICTCGHPADMHQGYGVLNCLVAGCTCQEMVIPFRGRE